MPVDSTLDKIDHKILKHLLSDGRASFSTIAKDAKLTDVAIKKRYERLKRKGIISAITADLNLKNLGYENPIFVQMRTELSKTKNIIKKMNEMDYIVELNQVLGEYNLLAKLVVPDLSSAEKFINRLGNLDGIIDVKTLVILSELKRTNSLPSHSFQNHL